MTLPLSFNRQGFWGVNMSEYQKYQHVEKLGTRECEDITIGRCYVFPKLDGTNAQAWFDGEKMRYGSRKRELSLEKDNAGFMREMSENEKLTVACKAFRGCRVYGEWLVPHSLKTYRDDAWRRFYVFDIQKEDGSYVLYDDYQPILEDLGVDYVAPLRIINNPTYENLIDVTNQNDVLIKDGEGRGEGVVVKNYDFVNRHGRTTWAKIVTSEFREKHAKTMGAPEGEGSSLIEEDIVNRLLSPELIGKVKANLESREDGWHSKLIGELLGTVFYDFVREHSWDIVKKFKSPTLNYKTLQRFVTLKTKETLPEIF